MSFIDASTGPVLAHIVDKKYSAYGYSLVFALADMSFCVGYSFSHSHYLSLLFTPVHTSFTLFHSFPFFTPLLPWVIASLFLFFSYLTRF